jgi:hypothetical protein
MAFEKSIETDFGVTASYWRLVAVQHDIASGNGAIVLAGYADKAAREAAKKPMATHTLNYINAEYGADDDRAAVYQKLKANAPWLDATDA